MSNKKICVYLDRDGVINSQEHGFVNEPSDLEFIFGSPEAIKKLNQNKIMTIVVTNQGGIATGHLTKQKFLEITTHMHYQLKKFNAKIDHVYYCESNDDKDYYRKPNPGMILGSSKALKLDSYKKYMIGDRCTDIIAGNRSNCETILVLTGEGRKEKKKINSILSTPDHICENLAAAVRLILENENLK